MKRFLLLLVFVLGFAQAEIQPVPTWMSAATIYQVFIRNHTLEGTFKSATSQLEKVRDLGVNTIYLLPFYPTGKIKRIGSEGSPFSIRDYTAVDSSLGTLEDFKAYVTKAHALGLKVMVDIVFNHTSWDHVWITEHPEYYRHDASNQIMAARPEWQDVAGLDSSRTDVQDALIEVGEFWVSQGVDGFRADYSTGLPLSFWQRFRSAIKAINPENLLLAETGDAPYHDNAFDLSYDWQGYERLLSVGRVYDPANSFFAYQSQQGDVPKLRYFENHDQERIANRLYETYERSAIAALLLTEPGVPLIYAGQESALEKRPSLFNRDPFPWNKGDTKLRDWYKQLLRVRANLEPLQSGLLRLISGQPSAVAAFTRFTPQQKVVVLINFSDKPQTVKLPWAKTWFDQITKLKITAGTWKIPSGKAQILLDHP
jgi:glycosidase